MIGVIDYRAGNAPSVGFALERLGIAHRLVRDATALKAVDRIILPGVGAADATLASLREAGLIDAIRARVEDGTPFLGICVGLQVLFDHSEEGDTPCLGWIAGSVRRFPDTDRVPQIGWNEVQFTRAHPLRAELPDTGAYYYFVNSYYATPTDPSVTLGAASYSAEFTAMAVQGNIAATQFHAEKSGELGLQILTNFSTWDGSDA